MLVFVLLALPTPASAQSDERCFAETGQCISGAIRAYWERNGGLEVFGYPISPVTHQYVGPWQGPAQWFERDRLEDHSNEGLGVLAGRLGAQLLELQGRPWETLPRESGAPRGCRFFGETGHSLCGRFLRYWEANGGLERFGYPITAETTESIGEWRGTVQYFERRRMEYHPENAGTRYETLLGLLGSTVSGLPGTCFEVGPPLNPTATAYRGAFGCAHVSAGARPLAYQPFERGAMIWMPGFGSRLGNGIVVLTRSPGDGTISWQTLNDTWAPGQPESGGETPPAGLYEPKRGFGLLWRDNPRIREALGWATAPETADQGVRYNFERGIMVLRQGANRVHLLHYNGNRAEEIAPLP